MLNFSTSQDKTSLLLNDRPYYPLDWPREESWILGSPTPSPTPFFAWQVQANISVEWLDYLYPPGEDEYGRLLGTDMGGFGLGYEYILFPARDPSDILLLFNLIGITDGYEIPRVDMDFVATNRTKETVQIVLTRDGVTDTLSLLAVELVSKLNLNAPAYAFGEEFNRRLDLQASEPNQITFIPREWDICGYKDDYLRQRLCDIRDWWSDTGKLVAIIVGSVIGGILVLAGLFYLLWLLVKIESSSVEYAGNLQKNDAEAERLIDLNDLQDDAQGYTPEKTQDLPEGDLLVIVDGESNSGQADLHTTRELGTSELLPHLTAESDPTAERHMSSHDHSVSSRVQRRFDP